MIRLLSALLVGIALAGCIPEQGRHRAGHQTAPQGPGHSVRAPRVAAVADAVRIEESGPIACAGPELRVGEHFRVQEAGTLPTSEQHLWGSGMVLGDFTGDGDPELFQVGETESSWWVANHAPDQDAFQLIEEFPPWLAALDLDFGVGGVPVDLDGDGWLDLAITRWDRPNRLLRNLEGSGFEDVTPAAMLAHSSKTQSATAGDIDGDGDLDLFFGNYAADPDGFGDQLPAAQPSELYRNDGGGQWTDVSDRLPAEIQDGYTFASGLYDLDADGLPELVVSNDYGGWYPSVLAANQGDFRFAPDTGWHPDVEDMGMGVGDLNHDEVPDFLITSWRTISLLLSGEATGLPGTWISSADAVGIAVEEDIDAKRQDFGFGVELADIDNDGDLDGLAVFGDWEVWTSDPAEQDALWLQTSELAFQERAADPEWDLADDLEGRSLVVADLNNDGWLDVVKRNVNQPTRVHHARCGDETWLRVSLDWTGPNSRGIGARVRAITAEGSQIRWITAGSTGQYTGQPPEAHFGLGAHEVIEALQIEWPDGEVSAFQGISTRQRVRIFREPGR